MSIDIGDTPARGHFPGARLGWDRDLEHDDVFGGKKVVLFAVPGAFTPTCHFKHLPGFIENAEDVQEEGRRHRGLRRRQRPLRARRLGRSLRRDGKVLFLSDGNAEFTKKIGMDFDGSGIGLGTRSKRYAMLVEDGVVKALNVEDSPGVAEDSTAAKMLERL